MSEEFGGALPTVIYAEQQRLPAGFLERVIELRQYRAAYYAFRANPKEAKGGLVDLVKEIEFGLAQAEIDEEHGQK